MINNKVIMEGGGKTFSERNPVVIAPNAPLRTLRERLDARGRLEDFERRLADRRRARIADPQVAVDDEYRAKQRVASQMVFNQFFGVASHPPQLTGEGHHNPSVEAVGGKVGLEIRKAINPAIDTNREVLDSTR